MPDFAHRLRAHRLLLGLSQQALAQACGISWEQQRAYEEGARGPHPEYLQALADAGLTVAYLITGEFPQRSPPGMSREEFALLDNLRHCDEQTQAQAAQMLQASVAQHPGSGPPRPRLVHTGQIIDLARARRERTKS